MKTRRLSTAVALATVALLASACSGGSDPLPRTHAPLPTLAPSDGASPSATIPAGTISVAPDSEAAKAFGGADKVRAGVLAAQHVVDVANGLTQALAKGVHNASTYEPLYGLLTPETVKVVKAAANAGDPKGLAFGLCLTSRDSDGSIPADKNGGRLVLTAPYVTSRTQGTASVSVDTSEPRKTRLTVETTSTVTYVGTRDGKQASVALTRTWTLQMLPVGSGWLVDGFTSSTDVAA